MRFFLIILALILGVAACNQKNNDKFNLKKQGRNSPPFNADSAYHFVKKQVDFGPRNPGSEGHKQTREYLVTKLKSLAGVRSVFSQPFTADGYQSDTLQLTNIIAAFNPQSRDRIILCAHWDTRPRADRDPEDKEKPILGADDGASGVGVLLEMARIFKENPPPIGVDIVLFDGEDYGKEGDLQKYFLGSRYWAENPPVKGYNPRFGILLDMVGGKDAQFPKEGYSLRYAPALVNELWGIAQQQGNENLFPDKTAKAISDDHVVINQVAGIPTIDIIRQNPAPDNNQFAPYWHTHNDDMSNISKKTLAGVGELLTEVIYNRINKSN
jgi:site-specific DNA-cytosine methylase